MSVNFLLILRWSTHVHCFLETPFSCCSSVQFLPTVLTCPVMFFLLLSVMPLGCTWPQSHRDLLYWCSPNRQRVTRVLPLSSVSVSLCASVPQRSSPCARPGFGTVNFFLFFLPYPLLSFSLSWHKARLPYCSSTLSIAEVLLHEFLCIVHLSSSPVPAALFITCLA